MISWLHATDPTILRTLFNCCITDNVLPWPVANVAVVPKPGKSDYTQAKAYRPISLLECPGRVLERVLANRMNVDVLRHNVLPMTQFSRCYNSATDAALSLKQKAASCIQGGRVGLAILFDISGFFDSLSPTIMATTLRSLGFPDVVNTWVETLMGTREVHLKWTNFRSGGHAVMKGTPQGSPLSPLLSALYTSHVLRRANDWEDGDLSLYVDDGCIFVSSKTFKSATEKGTRYFNDVIGHSPTSASKWTRTRRRPCFSTVNHVPDIWALH
jgi:hypothetical protein